MTIHRPKNTTGSVMDPIFQWRPEPDAPIGCRLMVRSGFTFKVARLSLTSCSERVWIDDKGDRVTDVTGWLPLNGAVRMKRKKKRQRDIVRYLDWLRISDVYPDLTFGEFLRNGCGGRKQKRRK